MDAELKGKLLDVILTVQLFADIEIKAFGMAVQIVVKRHKDLATQVFTANRLPGAIERMGRQLTTIFDK